MPFQEFLTHIDVVRHHFQMVQHKFHQSACHQERISLWGGLILSLDLSKAFDLVHRPLLFPAPCDFGAPDDLCACLYQIYSKTSFLFEHRGVCREVATHRGIGQGCQAAPCLWLVYLGRLMHKLSHLTSLQWLQNHNTTYADDWIIHKHFLNLKQFHLIIQNISILFSLLAEYGRDINFDKTVIILRATGSDLMKMQRRYIHRSDAGAFLKMPKVDGSFIYLRLGHQHVYLGVKIGYGAYQQQSIAHRLTCAKNAAFLLSKWLRGRGGLFKFQRAKLWQQCILTSLLHALGHVGFSPSLLTQFDSWCLTQLRHIFKNQFILTISIILISSANTVLKIRC